MKTKQTEVLSPDPSPLCKCSDGVPSSGHQCCDCHVISDHTLLSDQTAGPFTRYSVSRKSSLAATACLEVAPRSSTYFHGPQVQSPSMFPGFGVLRDLSCLSFITNSIQGVGGTPLLKHCLRRSYYCLVLMFSDDVMGARSPAPCRTQPHTEDHRGGCLLISKRKRQFSEETPRVDSNSPKKFLKMQMWYILCNVGEASWGEFRSPERQRTDSTGLFPSGLKKGNLSPK